MPNRVASMPGPSTAATASTGPAAATPPRLRHAVIVVMTSTISGYGVSTLCLAPAVSVDAVSASRFTGCAQEVKSARIAGPGTVKGMTMANAETSNELRRPDGGPVRVLVVDDEPTLAELLSMALRSEGWDVRSAPEELAPRRTARDFRPDAVVLDMMLPDIDGLEV